MIEFDEGFYNVVFANMKARAFSSLLCGLGMPEDDAKLFECMIRAGCPEDALLKGVKEYAEYLESKEGSKHESNA